MVTWYVDTETVQLNFNQLHLADGTIFERHVRKRLDMSKDFLDKRRSNRGDYATAIVVNIFTVGLSEDNYVIQAHFPHIFFNKIVKRAREVKDFHVRMYFNNVKFDMFNLLDYIHSYNIEFKEKSVVANRTKIYQYSFIYKGVYIELVDAFNLIMLPLSAYGKAFQLPEQMWKSSYDFDFNNEGVIKRLLGIDNKLEKYSLQDVVVLKAGVEAFKKEVDYNKLTIGSTAFADWQQRSDITLPTLTQKEQHYANLTYQGGICTFNPFYQGQVLEGDFVYLDFNGLYSAASLTHCGKYYHPFPCGMGRYHRPILDEEPDFWDEDKYYTCRVRLFAIAKSSTTVGFLRLGKQYALGEPMSRAYKQNEYLRWVDETVFLNSIQLRLLYKYYHVQAIEFIEWYEYDTCHGIFEPYIEYWSDEKVKAGISGNAARREVTKRMLNSLTGKFGQKIEDIRTSIKLGDKSVMQFERSAGTKPDKYVYMPIISAILSYSHEMVLDLTNSYPRSNWLYMDTDSNILTREAYDRWIDKSILHKTELGKVDMEYEIRKLLIVRQKTYMMELHNGQTIIKCAGATQAIKDRLNFDNFKLGEVIEGAYQLKPDVVPGGIALERVPFVLRAAFMS